MEETPLAFAAGIGNVDIVQALITEGADVNRICSVNHCTHVILHIYLYCVYIYKYEKHFQKMYRDVGMAVPKTTETRCRDGSVQARHVKQRLHN